MSIGNYNLTTRLKRHPFPVVAWFDRVLAGSFAFPEEVLRPLVPEVWSEPGILKWKGEVGRIDLKTADIARILQESQDDSLGLISASNLPDVMDGDAWDKLVGHAARVLMPGGYLVVRSMLQEIVVSKSDSRFAPITDVPEDASPICPVIWIGRKL